MTAECVGVSFCLWSSLVGSPSSMDPGKETLSRKASAQGSHLWACNDSKGCLAAPVHQACSPSDSHAHSAPFFHVAETCNAAKGGAMHPNVLNTGPTTGPTSPRSLFAFSPVFLLFCSSFLFSSSSCSFLFCQGLLVLVLFYFGIVFLRLAPVYCRLVPNPLYDRGCP